MIEDDYMPLKVLFDNNIVLDFISKRPPYYEESRELFLSSLLGVIKGYITSSQLPSVTYIAPRELKLDDERKGREKKTHKQYEMLATLILEGLTQENLVVAGVDAKMCEAAFKNEILGTVDYEDALLDTFSELFIDYIVTRDRDFENASPKGISPENLIAKIRRRSEQHFHFHDEVASDIEQ